MVTKIIVGWYGYIPIIGIDNGDDIDISADSRNRWLSILNDE